jgi:hypothetical protein
MTEHRLCSDCGVVKISKRSAGRCRSCAALEVGREQARLQAAAKLAESRRLATTDAKLAVEEIGTCPWCGLEIRPARRVAHAAGADRGAPGCSHQDLALIRERAEPRVTSLAKLIW